MINDCNLQLYSYSLGKNIVSITLESKITIIEELLDCLNTIIRFHGHYFVHRQYRSNYTTLPILQMIYKSFSKL